MTEMKIQKICVTLTVKINLINLAIHKIMHLKYRSCHCLDSTKYHSKFDCNKTIILNLPKFTLEKIDVYYLNTQV